LKRLTLRLHLSLLIKGKWEYQLMQNFGYDYFHFGQGYPTADHEHILSLDLGAKYFVAKGLGVGLELDLQSTVEYTNQQTEYTSTNWMVYGGTEYGIDLNRSLGFYFGADIGIGQQISKYDPGELTGSKSRTANTLFGWKVEAGLPIRLFQSSPSISPRRSRTIISTCRMAAQNRPQTVLASA
jgi:hypothetical protein